MEILYGLHPVEEALRAGGRRFDHVCIARDRHDDRLQRVIDLCRDLGVRLRFEPRDQLTQLAKSPGHQGVVAVVRAKAILDLEDLFAAPPSKRGVPAQKGETAARLLLALDGVEDPQNLGALLRTADGAGVDGVILTERRAAPLSAVAVKASAGAAEHVRIARVINMTRSLEQLKERGIWCVGLDERATMDYDAFDYTGDCVLVLGREGAGLHDLVRRTCDQLLRIPMAGAVSSLNVSVAGAVVLYEAFRQRRATARQALPSPEPNVSARPQKGLGSALAQTGGSAGNDMGAGVSGAGKTGAGLDAAAWGSPAPEELLYADGEWTGEPDRATKPVKPGPAVAKAKPKKPPKSPRGPKRS